MSADVEYGGLCSTCKHASDCTFPRDPHKPVLCCEEFDSGDAVPVKTMGHDTLPPVRPQGAGEESSAKYMGLCTNCENRGSCIFPKPEGGIWHCEEYR